EPERLVHGTERPDGLDAIHGKVLCLRFADDLQVDARGNGRFCMHACKAAQSGGSSMRQPNRWPSVITTITRSDLALGGSNSTSSRTHASKSPAPSVGFKS